MSSNDDLQNIAHKISLNALKLVNSAKSGHATSSTSLSEILSVLLFGESGMNVD